MISTTATPTVMLPTMNDRSATTHESSASGVRELRASSCGRGSPPPALELVRAVRRRRRSRLSAS